MLRIWAFRLAFQAITFVSLAFIYIESATAAGPSFDCAKASSAVENIICSDISLSELDARLGKYYLIDQDTLPSEEAGKLQLSQKAWIKTRNSSCNIHDNKDNDYTLACLQKLYDKRITELENVRLKSAYGVLSFRNIGLGARGEPYRYIRALYDSLLNIDGPLKHYVAKIVKDNCGGAPVAACGPQSLFPPRPENTVIYWETADKQPIGNAFRLRSFLRTALAALLYIQIMKIKI